MKMYGMLGGGFLFEDPSAPTRSPSRIGFLPALSVIPLTQHAGKPARACVSVGDAITEGLLIGRGEGALSANIHASIPGRVIKNLTWKMGDGRMTQALVVRLDGSFEKLGKREELFSWNGLSPAELQRIIADKGVVEMEEPGRPLPDLIRKARNGASETALVVNAVFDDPWQAADYVVLSERLAAMAEALAILAKSSGSKRVLVAISDRDIALANALVEKAHDFSLALEMIVLKTRYPQHNTQELRKTIARIEKSGKRPPLELLVLSPSTLGAVYDAVRLNKPVMERYVAVGGAALKRPAILRVRLGTRVGDLIAECGGFADEVTRLVIGSPLTGHPIADLDVPVTKTTTAIVALTDSQIQGTAVRPCLGCGDCRTICPVRLDPERLYKLSLRGDGGQAAAEGASACQSCACCSAVCPSRIPLMPLIRECAEKERGKE